MKDFLSKLKIPTILGLGIIVLGIVSGVFLTLREQTLISQASTNTSPQNLTLTNITDTEVTISWQTSIPTPSFITFGQIGPNETTVLDDRDTNPPTGGPTPFSTHHMTIKNLTPKTTYQYKIVAGKFSSEINNFTTASPATFNTGFRPINGYVKDGDKPLEEGLVYLSINDAITQSAVIKTLGNFLIPISQLRKSDLSDNLPLTEDSLARLTILSPKGQASATFRLKDAENGLSSLILGEDVDLTDTFKPTPPPFNGDFDIYDLNGDKKINAADYSIVKGNQGKNPKDKEADLNRDGVVDQEDLDLMTKKIKDLGSQ